MMTRRRSVRPPAPPAPPAPPPSLTSVVTTAVHRRVALTVALALTLTAGMTLPVAHLAGPASPAFLPT